MSIRVLRAGAALACVAATIGALSAPGTSARTTRNGARVAVVVDTDLGRDDVIGLLYLAMRPDVDLRAVTVSGTGLVHARPGARHALDLLTLAGRRDVPVGVGVVKPLAGKRHDSRAERKVADELYGLALPPARAPVPRLRAVPLLRARIASSPRKVTVLALAPLTDIAALLRGHPEIARKLAEIVLVTGATTVSVSEARRSSPVAIDPLAARIVLDSGVPIRVVTSDATNHAPLTLFLADTFRRYHYATPEATLVWDLLAQTDYRGGSYLPAAIAATAVAGQKTIDFKARRVGVVDQSPGRTARFGLRRGGVRAKLAVNGHRRVFERALLATLFHGAPFQMSPHRVASTFTLTSRSCVQSGSLTIGPRALIDTVNRAGTPMTLSIGRLGSGKTLEDLRTFVDGSTAKPGLPAWFHRHLTRRTPPHSDMTWLIDLPLGNEVAVCTAGPPRQEWILPPVTVSSHLA